MLAAHVRRRTDIRQLTPLLAGVCCLCCCLLQVTVRLAMADTPCKIRVLPGTFTSERRCPPHAAGATWRAAASSPGLVPAAAGSRHRRAACAARRHIPLRMLAPFAADRAGEPTEGSNTLVAVWDTQPPEPIVNTIGSYQTTDQQRLPLVIDFGERVLQLNPLKLFSVTGFARCAFWLGDGWLAGWLAAGWLRGACACAGGAAAWARQLLRRRAQSVARRRGPWQAWRGLGGLPRAGAGRRVTRAAQAPLVLMPRCVPPVRRLDVLYEVLEGRIFLIGSISDPEVPVIVTGARARVLGQSSGQMWAPGGRTMPLPPPLLRAGWRHVVLALRGARGAGGRAELGWCGAAGTGRWNRPGCMRCRGLVQ